MKSDVIFTLVIDGRPVVMFAARRAPEAQEIAREQWLRSELERLTSGGKPLSQARSKVSVRAATASEQTVYRTNATKANGSRRPLLVYLVTLDG